MFYNTEDKDEIDLSNFHISSVLYMKEIFEGCGAKHIIFPKSKKILDISSMFAFTSNLQYLDLSGLDTSSVEKMDKIFYYW